MRVAGITTDSVVDGVGIRDVIFLQGCPHKCVGCHNPQTWNPDSGTEMSATDIVQQLKNSSNNITISGGEPFMQTEELLDLVELLTSMYPTKTIWIYTGYTFEEIDPKVMFLLYFMGVEAIVDGRFEEDKKCKKLRFRGSSNQRIIDLQYTWRHNQIVSWEETNEQV